jgi:hypothetical protein
MSSFHYKVDFLNDVTSLSQSIKTFMDIYYIMKMCEMLIFFPSMIGKPLYCQNKGLQACLIF